MSTALVKVRGQRLSDGSFVCVLVFFGFGESGSDSCAFVALQNRESRKIRAQRTDDAAAVEGQCVGMIRPPADVHTGRKISDLRPYAATAFVRCGANSDSARSQSSRSCPSSLCAVRIVQRRDDGPALECQREILLHGIPWAKSVFADSSWCPSLSVRIAASCSSKTILLIRLGLTPPLHNLQNS